MSKQVHYHKYFEENQKNYRALWIGINEIVYFRNKTFQQFLHKYWQKITKQTSYLLKSIFQDYTYYSRRSK